MNTNTGGLNLYIFVFGSDLGAKCRRFQKCRFHNIISSLTGNITINIFHHSPIFTTLRELLINIMYTTKFWIFINWHRQQRQRYCKHEHKNLRYVNFIVGSGHCNSMAIICKAWNISPKLFHSQNRYPIFIIQSSVGWACTRLINDQEKIESFI